MKKLTLTVISILSILLIACKSGAAKQEGENSSSRFNEKSEEEGFAEAHDEPEAIALEAAGKMMLLPTKSGDSARVYSLIQEGNNAQYLIVLHEWWGLNDFVKQEADRLFQELTNVNVMAVDLYDGRVATKREEAQTFMKSVTDERAYEIIDAALNKIGPDAAVATIGWCFGGGWSMKTAIRAGIQTRGCVMYYGMPVQEKEKLAKLNSDLLFIYGTQDNWINKEVADQLKANLKAVNKEVEVLAFDANHAFANPTQESYKEEAALEANAAALEYLKSKFN